MNSKERILIHIPADENYIEILGFKIDGFNSFEAFLKHLEKYAKLEEENNLLKDEKECLIDTQKNLQKILSEKIAERDSIKAEIEELKSICDKERADRLYLSQQNKAIISGQETLQKALAKSKAKIEALQMDNAQLQSDNINANMNLEHLTAEIEKLRKSLSIAQESLNTIIRRNGG